MSLPRLHLEGDRFVDEAGRHVILRGVNLGGDCKVPYPDGGTHIPTDFADHREVSFIGRPFPLSEAEEHLGRLRHWGFNCLRLLTTWEACEHEGPGKYDEAYLDYFAEVCRLAGEYGLYVFIDFHQDVWSRMSGGDGAPGWTFEKAGLDFTTFHEAGAAKVMQHCYDYARGGGRQEDNYPTMTWAHNYRRPGNAIMWTLFFAGEDFAPGHEIDGLNAQAYLQQHYMGAMQEVAKRVKDMPHVLGFDTLNEPGSGWIGQEMSHQHTEKTEAHPERVMPGPAWSPLDGLLVARGIPRTIPVMRFDPAEMKMTVKGEERANENRVSIWRDGVACPFEQAGAYRLNANGEAEDVNETFFTRKDGRDVSLEADYMMPFFSRVADAIREVNPDWMVFAELDPQRESTEEGFPEGGPDNTVNASHWYDVVTLVTKTFLYPTSVNPFTGRTIEGPQAIEDHYTKQLGRTKDAAETLNGGKGAPTLIGEFGIPYDLDNAAAYKAWASGDRSEKPWEKHVIALDLMYNALDRLLLSSTHWNYTVSNSNDQMIGDAWNQEDLSIFSRDQQDNPHSKDSGGRALKGFCRPYIRRAQGEIVSQKFDLAHRKFVAEISVDKQAGPTEIYVPRLHYGSGCDISLTSGRAEFGGDGQVVMIKDVESNRLDIVIQLSAGA